MSIARWLRVDLHTHTPFDVTRPWGRSARSEREKGYSTEEGQARAWLDRCDQAELDVVAITDHNSLVGYDKIVAAYDQWRADTGSSLLVLPGVELSVAGCHFLVIGDPDERAHLEQLVGWAFRTSNPITDDEEPNEAVISVPDLAREIQDAAASGRDILAMAAHVNRDKGLAKVLKGLMRKHAFAQRAWSGFQVRGADFHNSKDLLRLWASARLFGRLPDQLDQSKQQQLQEFLQRDRWPFVDASDPEALKDLGAAFTWMKMSVPGVEGIRQALLDPESRLRRCTEDPPAPPPTWIERIEVEGVRTEGERPLFGGSLAVELSPALNTVIGGRGAGKSTLLELIRWVLDRTRPDDFSGREQRIRDRVEQLLSPEGILRADSRVRVIVRRDGRPVEVVRTLEELRAAPRGGDGEWDARTLVEPRILSQRQISDIADDPRAILREVDEVIADKLREWREERAAVVRKIEDLQRQRRELRDRLAQRKVVETSIEVLEGQIDRLERAAESDVLRQHRDVRHQQRWLEEIAGTIDEVATTLPEEPLLGAGWPPFPPEGPAAALLAGVRESLADQRQGITQRHKELVDTLAEARQRVADARRGPFAAVLDPIAEDYDALVQALRTDGLEIGQLDALQVKLAAERKREEALRKIPAELERVQEELRSSMAGLDDLYGARRARREEVATRLEERDADIRIRIEGFGDREEFAEQRGRWWGGTRMRTEDWRILVDWVYQGEQDSEAESVPDRWRRLVDAFRTDHEQLSEQAGEATAVRSLVGSSPTQFLEGALRAIDPGQFDTMERFLPGDLVAARFRDGDTFRSITRGSLGQRNTAVLSMLLTVGEGPLLLDQPEDDLDNRYIYDVVVDLLRAAKTERQIIVATHNANVPVNGDAELIVALDPARDGSVPVIAGTLEDSTVKEAVSTIMEGSETAFRLRRQRYGY